MPDNFDFTIISVTIAVCGGIFSIVGTFVLAVSTWRNGSNKIKDGIISDLKTAVEVKTEEVTRLNEEKSLLIASHQLQLTQMQKEITEFKTRLEETNKRLEDYKALLTNRDPKTLEMLTEIKNGISILNTHHLASDKNLIKAAAKVAENK